jgi:hypothetical protein
VEARMWRVRGGAEWYQSTVTLVFPNLSSLMATVLLVIRSVALYIVPFALKKN